MEAAEDTVRELAEILDPPERPIPTPWHEAPREVGFQFPADYRHFCDRFGGGWVSGELHIPAPTEESRCPDLPAGFRGVTAAADSVRETCGTDHELMAWGSSFDFVSDHAFWLMQGDDPDQWPVVVRSWKGGWFRFDGGMAAFLLELVKGRHAESLCPAAACGDPYFIRTHTWTQSSQGSGV